MLERVCALVSNGDRQKKKTKTKTKKKKKKQGEVVRLLV